MKHGSNKEIPSDTRTNAFVCT